MVLRRPAGLLLGCALLAFAMYLLYAAVWQAPRVWYGRLLSHPESPARRGQEMGFTLVYMCLSATLNYHQTQEHNHCSLPPQRKAQAGWAGAPELVPMQERSG
jgi:hypothetical protein